MNVKAMLMGAGYRFVVAAQDAQWPGPHAAAGTPRDDGALPFNTK
jgi:hypothetical protein